MTRLLSLLQLRRFMSVTLLLLTVSGCATMRTQPHAFFLPEQDRETHGRKTWFDRLVELDPGHITVTVAADYAQNPPRRIAVLPFVDQGSAQFVVNKIPLSFRDAEEQESWAWTYANRLRRALTGYLGREIALGVRPEHLQDGATAPPELPRLRATEIGRAHV